jgi:MFS family permease
MLQRIAHARQILRKQYLALAIVVSFLYIFIIGLVLAYVYNGIHIFYTSGFPSYTIPFTILTIIAGMALGINVALLAAKFQEIRAKSAGMSVLGIFMGSLAIGCPGCFFGLFPIVLGVFGISGTLALLPLHGLELQVFSIIILVTGSLMLAKESEMVCKVKKMKKK